MPKGMVLLSAQLGASHARMAEEALKNVASRHGYALEVRTQVEDMAETAIASLRLEEIERVIVAGEASFDAESPERDKLVFVPVSVLIQHPEIALGLEEKLAPVVTAPVVMAPPEPVAEPRVVRLVAITSCPTGIAHTFMAAAALQKAAEELGYAMHVETQGSVGAKNTLSAEEIVQCSAAIIAADTHVDPSRFANVPLLSTSTNDAIHHGKDVLARALALPKPSASGPKTAASPQVVRRERTGAYKHLMTGVSHMLPLVTAGGLLIALAFAVGGIHAGDATGSFGWTLLQIGSGAAFKLYIPMLAAYIAYSIADRPGLCAGLVGGMLSMSLGAGFLGGIVAGFLAGYVTKLLNDALPLPEALAGLKPVLILPLLSTLIVGLAMIYVVGTPVRIALGALTAWLSGMQQGSALLLGLLLGGMMAFDMGGPVNKAAYTFSVGLLASNVHEPMAAVMAGGMTSPIGLALATLLARRRFTSSERQLGKVTAVLGLSFISEGAIPYAASDPLRVIPCLVVGSAITGAISMAGGCQLMVPHGGIFVLMIPHAVTHLPVYALAIVAGSLVTALLLAIFKRKPQEVTTL
ncbi:fructose-specific PTS transporter subunit EIIC [Telmatobacter bradus]|uniref:fructose-specific PTS transporter subunit EIIC n=1 Tax=Telmatobacter bradus TaxID=474953 RepID=UPI003B43AAF9